VPDQDLLVGDEDALHYQPQYLLLELEGRARQPRADPLAELRDGLLKCRCSFGLYLLSLQHLLSLVKLFARLPQPPSALFELIELDGPSLVGIDQALLFPLQCRPPIAHSLQLPLRICCLRPFPFLLLSHIAYDDLRSPQQPRYMLPHQRFDVPLADRTQMAPTLRWFRGATPGAFVAATGNTGVSAQSPSAVTALQKSGQQVLVTAGPAR
jgi:hypothetical protein